MRHLNNQMSGEYDVAIDGIDFSNHLFENHIYIKKK